MGTEKKHMVLPAFYACKDWFKKNIILKKIMSKTAEMKT